MSSSRAFESAARICASSASSSLPCAADRLEHRRAPLLQLPQVAQPLLERAQLGVVEGAGHLLAVSRDERHGRAAVEQLDGRGHLPLAHAELVGDPTGDGQLLLLRHERDPIAAATPVPPFIHRPPVCPQIGDRAFLRRSRRGDARLPREQVREPGEEAEADG